eukprot:gnl/TRDRNA2_/TRDRNA2_177506_c0_seq12.p1 gnl/TRDRNA2_/TRDRNA2_177506_c0~~gnl/TRDRNA2_/TRDRNA2_177506_c0_seq12.p1  ORF type:complete len:312 (-),score=121.81 gnl/TRDRNA2_/TRDRNA2_177506_c0_seq12:444-1310(-)
MFDFPADALKKPSFATDEQWELIGGKSSPVADSAIALVEVVTGFVAQATKDVEKAEAEEEKETKGKAEKQDGEQQRQKLADESSKEDEKAEQKEANKDVAEKSEAEADAEVAQNGVTEDAREAPAKSSEEELERKVREETARQSVLQITANALKAAEDIKAAEDAKALAVPDLQASTADAGALQETIKETSPPAAPVAPRLEEEVVEVEAASNAAEAETETAGRAADLNASAATEAAKEPGELADDVQKLSPNSKRRQTVDAFLKEAEDAKAAEAAAQMAAEETKATA